LGVFALLASYPFAHSLLLLLLYYKVDAPLTVLLRLPLNMERLAPLLYVGVPLVFLSVLAFVPSARGRRIAQTLAIAFVLVLGVIRALQTVSIVQSRRYITPDALAHIDDVGLVMTGTNLAVFALTLAAPALSAFLIAGMPAPTRRPWPSGIFIASGIALFGLLANAPDPVQPFKQVAHDYGILREPERSAWRLFFGRPARPRDASLSPETLRKLRDIGVDVDPARPLPFAKQRVFEVGIAKPWPAFDQAPDVIIVLAESLSADLLGCYGSPFKDVTPSLDALAARSIRFTRYFNHTTPTISGVHGTLASIYETVGHGFFDSEELRIFWETPVLSIAHVLGARGYETTFMAPGSRHYTHFEEVVANLGFEKALFRDGIEKEFGNVFHAVVTQVPGTYGGRYLSDIAMFQALDALMQAPSPRPRLVVVSTMGTHFPYQYPWTITYGDGSRPLLNALHTLDRGIGEAVRLLTRKSAPRETVLVVTGDHAMVPTTERRGVAAPGHASDYYEEIALLVSRTGVSTPRVVNTLGSSVDLVPTLLHLLDINVANPFMGRSLFAARGRVPFVLGSQSEIVFAAASTMRVFGDVERLDQWPGLAMENGDRWTAADFGAWLRFLHATMVQKRIWKR
jgi:hypothetical protein